MKTTRLLLAHVGTLAQVSGNFSSSYLLAAIMTGVAAAMALLLPKLKEGYVSELALENQG